MSDLIQAISRGCKGTLADGTVRYTIDIEPNYAATAAALFGMPGTALAIAALKDGHQMPQKQPEIEQESNKHGAFTVANEKPIKGGALAKWAGILCNDPEFFEWLSIATRLLNFDITNSAEAKLRVIEICGINSRAELDHDPIAAKIFREQIMAPFNAWKESRA